MMLVINDMTKHHQYKRMSTSQNPKWVACAVKSRQEIKWGRIEHREIYLSESKVYLVSKFDLLFDCVWVWYMLLPFSFNQQGCIWLLRMLVYIWSS